MRQKIEENQYSNLDVSIRIGYQYNEKLLIIFIFLACIFSCYQLLCKQWVDNDMMVVNQE